MAGEVISARLSQLEAFGTKVVADFSALTARVQSLERAGGQPNIIEKILVNGIQLAVDGNKAVNFSVPTKTSQLENDTGFQNGTQVNEKLSTKADSGHDHDGRYFTKEQVNSTIAGKADTGHTHDDRYYTESEMNTKLNGKANASHTHDDRYYTESEMNTKLNGKANSSHTHNYAGSSSAGGTANSVNGLTFAAQTTDPGAGSSLATNKVLIVYA